MARRYTKGMDIETLLKLEEGFEPCVYKDSEGFWTIGYGLLVDDRKPGAGLTERQATILLRDQINEKASELDSRLPWWRQLSETRQTVLLAMAFQMGVAGVVGFKNTLAALKSGDYAKAAKGMRGSKWAQQTPGRAERMAVAIETDVLK